MNFFRKLFGIGTPEFDNDDTPFGETNGDFTPNSRSLDPETVVDPRLIGELEAAAQALAEFPQPTLGDSTNALLRPLNNIYQDYLAHGRQLLAGIEERLGSARTSFEALSEQVAMSDDSAIRAHAESIVARMADNTVGIDERVKGLRHKGTLLTVGIMGSPDREIKTPGRFQTIVIPITLFVVTVTLEFMLNFDLVRFASDRMVSTAFSVVISLFGFLAAWVAAKAMRMNFTYRNAKTVHREHYGRLRADPNRPEVFPRDARQQMMSIAGHVGLIALVAMVSLFRIYVISTETDPNYGSFAGTFAFVFVLTGFYLYEVFVVSGVEHPRLEELLDVQAQLEELEAELALLQAGDGEFREELNAVVDEHARTAAAQASKLRAVAVSVESLQGDYRTRASELDKSHTWFLNTAAGLLSMFFQYVGILHPDQLEDMEYKPSGDEMVSMARNVLRLEPTPAPASILDYKPNSPQAGTPVVTSDALFTELWPTALKVASDRVRQQAALAAVARTQTPFQIGSAAAARTSH